jgi:hypothetical protein
VIFDEPNVVVLPARATGLEGNGEEGAAGLMWLACECKKHTVTLSCAIDQYPNMIIQYEIKGSNK